MIEFKAECGHTIRAKDEDEGKVVRCSYCGREAQVPQDDQDDLDYLFSEVEASEAEAKGASPKKLRHHRRRTVGAITTGRADVGFNPLGVALKMAYVAALVIVLIVVAKVSYNAWTSSGGGLSGYDREKARQAKNESKPGAKNQKQSGGRQGLLSKNLNLKKGGIYVSSVPPGAMVRVRKDETATIPEIFRDPEAKRCTANSPVELEPGRYEVAVGVKVTDGSLRKYPEFKALRRKIESGAPRSVLEAYFLPDGAKEVTTVELPNQPIVIVRKYECEVLGKDWTPRTALFLPDRPLSELMHHLPRNVTYGFKDEDVDWELEFFEVPSADWKLIVDALHRVGMVMYRIPNSATYRCFRINLIDGSLTAVLSSDTRKSVDGSAKSGRPPRSKGGTDRGRTPGSS